MAAQLVTRDDTIPVKDLPHGKIGMITEWSNDHEHVGSLVVKCQYNSIQVIGSTKSWSEAPNHGAYRVKILQPGDQIEIT